LVALQAKGTQVSVRWGRGATWILLWFTSSAMMAAAAAAGRSIAESWSEGASGGSSEERAEQNVPPVESAATGWEVASKKWGRAFPLEMGSRAEDARPGTGRGLRQESTGEKVLSLRE
jgi:hypothetical protein